MTDHMKKVLVAEDDTQLIYSLDSLLTLDGFEVVGVLNGEEAFNALYQHPFDLLITDIAMPQLNGFELIKKLRSSDIEVPIMVVSGKVDEVLRLQLSQLNVNQILHKPININQLRKMLAHFFPQ